jgi:RNA polymerase sigma factor (sigma-70 family)
LDGSVKELTAAIASGDTEAFARFFRDRFPHMYADARRATDRDESFCLDVVQDAMMRVIRSIKVMDTEQRLRNWLRVVVQTCAYDRLRMELRRRQREEARAQDPAWSAQDDGAVERLAWIRSELTRADDPAMQVLTMRYRFGWTLERIGAALGLKPGAVDGRVRRALTQLRSRAQETFHD